MDDTSRSPSAPYRVLLTAAYELGRADGLVAAGFEAPGTVDPLGSTCRGRDAEQFARLLWATVPDSLRAAWNSTRRGGTCAVSPTSSRPRKAVLAGRGGEI